MIGGFPYSQLDTTDRAWPESEPAAEASFEKVRELLEVIAKRGVSILLVEQKLTIALKISKRVFVMGHGKIVFEGTPEDLRANEEVRREWLEV